MWYLCFCWQRKQLMILPAHYVKWARIHGFLSGWFFMPIMYLFARALKMVSIHQCLIAISTEGPNELIKSLSKDTGVYRQEGWSCLQQWIKMGVPISHMIHLMCVTSDDYYQWLCQAEANQCIRLAVEHIYQEEQLSQQCFKEITRQLAYPAQLLIFLSVLLLFMVPFSPMVIWPKLLLVIFILSCFRLVFYQLCQRFPWWKSWQGLLWLMRFVALEKADQMPHVAVLMATQVLKHPDAQKSLLYIIQAIEQGDSFERLLHLVICVRHAVKKQLIYYQSKGLRQAFDGLILDEKKRFLRIHQYYISSLIMMFYCIFSIGFLCLFYIVYQPILSHADVFKTHMS